MHHQLVLVGFGNVGQALVRLLLRKREQLARERGLTFSFTGIATGRHGMAIDPAGLDVEKALALAAAGQSINSLSTLPAPADSLAFVQACPGTVLFENSPVNRFTGQPALDHLKLALRKGMHAITANKGPVVHGYRELKALAAENNCRFMFESTVMDGAPIFSLFREPLPCADLLGFHGILNSCTNLILTRMETGETFEDAVRYAQSIGIAETDPSADVDGWDAAIKVAALSTVLMGIPLTPQQVNPQGISGITSEQVAAAKREGKRWKLVCRARREGNEVRASVQPEMVGADSPLYCINGTSSYAQFALDVLPGLGVVENDPGPETTAFGLLADFINAAA